MKTSHLNAKPYGLNSTYVSDHTQIQKGKFNATCLTEFLIRNYRCLLKHTFCLNINSLQIIALHLSRKTWRDMSAARLSQLPFTTIVTKYVKLSTSKADYTSGFLRDQLPTMKVVSLDNSSQAGCSKQYFCSPNLLALRGEGKDVVSLFFFPG